MKVFIDCSLAKGIIVVLLTMGKRSPPSLSLREPCMLCGLWPFPGEGLVLHEMWVWKLWTPGHMASFFFLSFVSLVHGLGVSENLHPPRGDPLASFQCCQPCHYTSLPAAASITPPGAYAPHQFSSSSVSDPHPVKTENFGDWTPPSHIEPCGPTQPIFVEHFLHQGCLTSTNNEQEEPRDG